MSVVLPMQAGTSGPHVPKQRKPRTRTQEGHAAHVDATTPQTPEESKKKKRRTKAEARQALGPQIAESGAASSSGSVDAATEDIPFDPKSILPATKPAKSISRLLEASSLGTQRPHEVSFECIDGFKRNVVLAPNSDEAKEEPQDASSSTSEKEREQFTAFGIKAYPTRAAFNDVCYDFVSFRRWCPHGNKCFRIHPIDKHAHLAEAIMDSVKFRRMKAEAAEKRETPREPDISASEEPTARVKLPAVSLLPKNASIDLRGPHPNRATKVVSRHCPSQSLPQRSEDVQHWDTLGGLNDRKWGGRVSSDTSSEEEHSVWDAFVRKNTLGWRLDGEVDDEACWSDSNKTSESHELPPARDGTTRTSRSIPSGSRPMPSSSSSVKTTCNTTSSATSPQTHRLPPPAIPSTLPPRMNQEQRERHPRPRTNEMCRMWLLHNACNKGYHCRYVHGDLEYDDERRAQDEPTTERPPEHVVRTLHNHIVAGFGSGFQVNELRTGFDSQWISLCGLPDVSDNAILKLLNSFGEGIEIHRPPYPTYPMTVRIRFSTSSEAFAAVAKLHGAKHFGTTLEAKTTVGSNGHRMTYQSTMLRIDWEVPCRNVYMGYANQLLAEQAVDDARIKPYEDFWTSAELHTGLPAVGNVTVKFRFLPVHVNQDDMKIFGPHQGMMTERPNIKDFTVQDMIKGIKRLLTPHRPKIADLDILPPPYKDGKMRAWVTFASAKDAQDAAQSLHNRKPPYMGGTRIMARHLQSVSFSLSSFRYRKVAAEIRALQEEAWKQGAGYNIGVLEKRGGLYSIKISGQDLKVLGRLKSEFDRVMNGEAVHEDGKVVWDNFFRGVHGVAFLQGLERDYPGITVECSLARRTIRLFGSAKKRALVRQKIIDMVKERRARNVYYIPLNRLVANAFADDKAAGMPALEAAVGEGNVTLDLWESQLVVTGDLDMYTTACDILNGFRQKHQMWRPGLNSGQLCPACISEVSSPFKLPCGHSWCRSCLQRYLQVATQRETSFPLVCHGVDKKCGVPIPVFAAKSILSVSDFDAILDAAFSSHIQTHPDEFHYCPTPDCQQVYRSVPGAISLQCPECLIQICTNCHSDAHDGLSCSEVHDGDELFKDWASKNDVKQCPNCRMAIEKMEGCNHMTCSMCQTHICWVCLETFKDGYAIYGHMQDKHGGSGI